MGAQQTLRFCAGNPEVETAWHRHSERQRRPTGSGCSERPRGCRTWRWGSSLAQPHAWRSSAGARPSAGRDTHTHRALCGRPQRLLKQPVMLIFHLNIPVSKLTFTQIVCIIHKLNYISRNGTIVEWWRVGSVQRSDSFNSI